MSLFTGIFYIRDSIDVLQCSADDAVAALRQLVGRLPHDDAFDFSEAEFAIITGTIDGDYEPQLSTVNSNVWYWGDGARFSDPIYGYLIDTLPPSG